jgi:hypothetical protein
MDNVNAQKIDDDKPRVLPPQDYDDVDISILDATNEDIGEDEQMEELGKCAESFKYFAETYIKITHPKRGLVPFRLYPYQERCIKDYDTYKHNIIRKFRQGGLTTLTVLWAMWRCMFKLDQKIMVLSKSDREATGAGKKCSYRYEHDRKNTDGY